MDRSFLLASHWSKVIWSERTSPRAGMVQSLFGGFLFFTATELVGAPKTPELREILIWKNIELLTTRGILIPKMPQAGDAGLRTDDSVSHKRSWNLNSELLTQPELLHPEPPNTWCKIQCPKKAPSTPIPFGHGNPICSSQSALLRVVARTKRLPGRTPKVRGFKTPVSGR